MQIIWVVAPIAERVCPAFLADLVLPEGVAMAAVSPVPLTAGLSILLARRPVL